MNLPEKQEFVVTKKGKVEAVEEKEALDNSLKNGDMKNKQERTKFIEEAMKEPVVENMKPGLEDEFAEVKKSVEDIQLKISQQQPIEVD